MQNGTRICLASIAAIVIHPLVVIAPRLQYQIVSSFSLSVLLLVMMVAALMLLVLGLPTFFLLCKFHRDSWISMPIAGFLVGELPVFLWFISDEKCSLKLIFNANGNESMCSLAVYNEFATNFGLHGLIGALVFYAVWQATGRSNNSPDTEI